MFKNIDKVKRYDYRIVIDYKIKGRNIDNFFPRKKGIHYVSDSYHCNKVYTDVNLENANDPSVKRYIESLIEKYQQPANIEKFHRTGDTFFTNKPIYTFGEWFERNNYMCELEDIECLNVRIVVDMVTELIDIPALTVKSELDLEGYLQLKEYMQQKINKSHQKSSKKPSKNIDKTKKE